MNYDNKKSADTWLTPKKAIKELRTRNCNTMIGEKTLRTLIRNGFPSISIGNRSYINIDTFNEDLVYFSKKKDVVPVKIDSNSRKRRKSTPKKYPYNNGTIRVIDLN